MVTGNDPDYGGDWGNRWIERVGEHEWAFATETVVVHEYQLEKSPDLATWTTEEPFIANDWLTVLPVTTNGEDRFFYRLRETE